jgi:hypothetical protein
MHVSVQEVTFIVTIVIAIITIIIPPTFPLFYESPRNEVSLSLSSQSSSGSSFSSAVSSLVLTSFRILVGKPQGKRPLGRRRRRWVDNIKTDLI